MEQAAGVAHVVDHALSHGVVVHYHEIGLKGRNRPRFERALRDNLTRALAPETVVVYGVALEVCDRYAVEGMLALHPGLDIVVVEDAVAALDPARGTELLDDWRRRGVRVLTTDQVLLEIGTRTGPGGSGVSPGGAGGSGVPPGGSR